MHDPATLAHAVRLSEGLFLRFIDGFDNQNRASRVPSLPNHLSWTLGHCALTMHRGADVVSGFREAQSLPTGDWVHGDGTAGDPSRYDTESVCLGSRPVDDASKYPRLDRGLAIFRGAVDKLAVAVTEATPAMLEKEISWGKSEMPAGDLVSRIVFHNGMHAGQISDLRRALSLGPVTG